tara:strand:+ start:367 stop:597 length:231 start_codon:yes stop_codon:yes gene_type:complete
MIIVTLPLIGNRETATDENPIHVDPEVYKDWANFELRVLNVDDESGTARCSVKFVSTVEAERDAAEAAVTEQLQGS